MKEMGKLIKEIVKTLTGIMGIRLKTDDVVSTVKKKTIELNNVIIKTTEVLGLASQKKVPPNQAFIIA